MRVLRALALLVVVVSIAAAAHVVHAFTQPLSDTARVAAQVRWLNAARADGAAQRMQELFPEGEFFTHLLTGLAAASTGDIDTVRSALAASGTPAVRDRFGDIDELAGGTFYRGWRLLLWAEQVRLSGADGAALLAEADAVQAALLANPRGVPASYPGGYWPCDAVVAMAAVVRARALGGDPIAEADLAAWRDRVSPLREPSTGLLPHRVSAAGVAEGPRGSSQAIIQAFWPDVDPAGAADQWQRFVATFVAREAGLVGVREHPRGTDAAGDVDSGPLLFGVSASASAVSLAAALRNGDSALALELDRQAEYLGLPLEWAGQRRFVFGLVPVGDAFVAWARSVPVAPASVGSAAPAALWWVHALVLLVPGLLAGVLLVRTRRPVPQRHATGRPASPAYEIPGQARDDEHDPNPTTPDVRDLGSDPR